MEETGLNLSGLSELLDIEEQTINRWEKDKAHKGNRPKYNAIILMLRKGATMNTLFGIDEDQQKKAPEIHNAEELKIPHADAIINTPEFREELLKALKMLKDEGY